MAYRVLEQFFIDTTPSPGATPARLDLRPGDRAPDELVDQGHIDAGLVEIVPDDTWDPPALWAGINEQTDQEVVDEIVGRVGQIVAPSDKDDFWRAAMRWAHHNRNDATRDLTETIALLRDDERATR